MIGCGRETKVKASHDWVRGAIDKGVVARSHPRRAQSTAVLVDTLVHRHGLLASMAGLSA